MQAVFDAVAPSEQEVVHRMRLAQERSRWSIKRRKSVVPVLWGVLAGGLLCGTAAAVGISSGALQFSLPVPPPTEGGAPDESPEVADTEVGIQGRPDKEQGPIIEALPKGDAEQKPSPASPDRTIEKARPTDAVGADQASSTWSPTPSTSVENPPPSSVGNRPRTPPETPEQIQASWESVARAMRLGENRSAQDAVEPLTRSADPETRDSARLVRLRLALGSDEEGPIEATAQQRQELEELASQGATSSIRASARRLMRRLSVPENGAPEVPETGNIGN